MTIHKEGRKLLWTLLLLLLGINTLVLYLLPECAFFHQALLVASIIMILLVLQFFRHPRRQIQYDEQAILAPADGKVVVVETTTEDEYFQDSRQQISIFMSPINVHVCRTPAAGVVAFFRYHAGKYLVAWHPKSSTANERTTMVIRLASGVEILVRQIAGAVARRIKWYVAEGHPVKQGQVYGFIKFGSRLDVFLPLDAKVMVKPGDKTKGGQTIIARIEN